MKQHARTVIVKKAQLALQDKVWSWMNDHDLTYPEAMQCILHCAELVNVYQIRKERENR